jgi:hypothetical protein
MWTEIGQNEFFSSNAFAGYGAATKALRLWRKVALGRRETALQPGGR